MCCYAGQRPLKVLCRAAIAAVDGTHRERAVNRGASSVDIPTALARG
jgi:hypothetical protein